MSNANIQCDIFSIYIDKEMQNMYNYTVHYNKEKIMEKISYSYTRQHLSEILNQVTDDSEIFCIERKNGKQIIMIDKENYDSLLETSYLLKSPKNAEMLFKGLKESKDEKGIEIEL